jgi:hypothetical protein
MGSITDAEMEYIFPLPDAEMESIYKEWAPRHAKRTENLEKISQAASELIKVIELDKSGAPDDDADIPTFVKVERCMSNIIDLIEDFAFPANKAVKAKLNKVSINNGLKAVIVKLDEADLQHLSSLTEADLQHLAAGQSS